jgi:hypothetical protein
MAGSWTVVVGSDKFRAESHRRLDLVLQPFFSHKGKPTPVHPAASLASNLIFGKKTADPSSLFVARTGGSSLLFPSQRV